MAKYDRVVRFILLMPWGRVGSNLLMGILRQSAHAKLNSEKFNQLKTADEQISWFNDFYELGAVRFSKPYMGSKQNFMAIRHFGDLEKIVIESSFRVVRLRRDNPLKAAVSQIRAEQYARKTAEETGVSRWGVKPDETALGPTEIDPDLLLKRMRIMETQQRGLMSCFSKYDVLDIEYEQINSGLEKVVAELREYLDMPQSPYEIPYIKATPNELTHAVTNFADVQGKVRLSEYSKWLE